MIIPWRKLFWVYLAMFLIVSCAGKGVHPNVRLTPPDDPDPFVVGSDVENWKEICLQRTLGDDPDVIGKYDCLTVQELRAIVRHRLRTDN